MIATVAPLTRMNTPSYQTFAPRTVAAVGTLTAGDFTLKHYAITHPAAPSARCALDPALLASALPRVDGREGCAGVGFVIEHQGISVTYLVLGWWDRENELPLRVWVCDDGGWRPARDGESACVWDLEVIWFERNAWVETMMAGRAAADGRTAYLARRFAGHGAAGAAITAFAAPSGSGPAPPARG